MIEVGENFDVLWDDGHLQIRTLAAPVREYRGFIMLPINEDDGSERMVCFSPEASESIGSYKGSVHYLGMEFPKLSVTCYVSPTWDVLEDLLKRRIDKLWEDAGAEDF